MAGPKKGLGRGFESLIPTDLLDDTFDPTSQEDASVSQHRAIAVADISANPDQPRRQFDPVLLQELADSIKEHGVIQPIVVTPQPSGDGYLIVAGERRFRATQLAGLATIPAVIRSMSGQQQLEVSLIENIQRRDLNSIETATAYAKLRDQFNLTSEQIAGRVHKSVSAVINTMRLLKLPKEVIHAIADGELNEGQARPLVGQDEDMIIQLVPRIIREGWSARKVEQYIVNYKKTGHLPAEPAVQPTTVESHHETGVEQLRQRLGSPVDIRVNSKGAGKIVIPFKDSGDFERLQQLLNQ